MGQQNIRRKWKILLVIYAALQGGFFYAQNWKIFPKRPGDLVEYGGEKFLKKHLTTALNYVIIYT